MDRDEEENKLREQLRQEWEDRTAKLKASSHFTVEKKRKFTKNFVKSFYKICNLLVRNN